MFGDHAALPPAGGRVIVAMSGGVDSAVAAARLHRAGFEVIGVTLHLWDYPEGGKEKSRCCAPEDQYDARRVADALGFQHFTFDRRALFAQEVVAPFVHDYAQGLTPSPCTNCNRTVKLHELLGIAKRLGAKAIATGHYARSLRDARGVLRIARGLDDDKDQSYFLYATPPELVQMLVFPLGSSKKPEVRKEAFDLALPGANKGESQELCFVGEDYAKFVEARAQSLKAGSIVGPSGKPVAEHNGVHNFTIGQRKGLGVALGEPVFVTDINAETGTVTLGPAADLLKSEAKLAQLFLAPEATLPLRVHARIRYRHAPVPATLSVEDGVTKLAFDEPVRAVTPGQIAVFYEGDCVIGGAVITSDGAQRKRLNVVEMTPGAAP
jgi:tRNA-uridine 2-sulfurtransferase